LCPDVLATAISKLSFVAGNDDLRPVMSGVFFQFSPEGLTLWQLMHKLVKYARTDVKASQVADFIKEAVDYSKNILSAQMLKLKLNTTI
jgi:DNA polymerase-3 subunit beta